MQMMSKCVAVRNNNLYYGKIRRQFEFVIRSGASVLRSSNSRRGRSLQGAPRRYCNRVNKYFESTY